MKKSYALNVIVLALVIGGVLTLYSMREKHNRRMSELVRNLPIVSALRMVFEQWAIADPAGLVTLARENPTVFNDAILCRFPESVSDFYQSVCKDYGVQLLRDEWGNPYGMGLRMNDSNKIVITMWSYGPNALNDKGHFDDIVTSNVVMYDMR